jgi:hypothetical protein
MVRPASPRTETLLRVYSGLLVISITLCGLLVVRHLPPRQQPAASGAIVTVAPAPTRGGAPTINWGGQKR